MPTKQSKKPADVKATLKRLEAKDPGLKQFLEDAYGYAVFPSVGKAALVIGGSYGHGEVFERGELIGHATIGQTTIGVQVGGDTFSEVIAFENKQSLDRFKQNKVRFAASASAVLVKAGAAGTANYEKGVAVFAYPSGGMLLELAIGGQKFKFKPLSDDGGEQGGAQAKDAQRGGEDDQDESGEQDDQQQQGILGRAGGIVSGAASKAAGAVKRHPVVTTAALVGLVGGFFALRAIYRIGLEEMQGDNDNAARDDRSNDEQDQDSSDAEGSNEQRDDDEPQDDEQQDEGNLHDMRQRRARS